MSTVPTVTTYDHGKPFVLLQPGHYPARSGALHGRFARPDSLPMLLEAASQSSVCAIDLETNGLTPYDEDVVVVGIGLAWDSGSCYVDIASIDDESYSFLLSWIASARNLIAHNVYFDGGFLWRDLGRREHPAWLACTYGLLYQLANEGFEGQEWGLKWAMGSLLGWENTNEKELDLWLVRNGHISSVSTTEKAGSYWMEDTQRWASPRKAEMWRAPRDILGKYCILDAEATYLLYTRVLLPALEKFPYLQRYHTEDFLPLVKILIEQYHRGVRVDVPGLLAHKEHLLGEMHRTEQEFRQLPEVRQHILDYEDYRKRLYIGEEPPRYKKETRKLGKEPNRLRKDGSPSKTWAQWEAKRLSIANTPPQTSANWTRWKTKLEEVEKGLHTKEYGFNVRSGEQLRWLLYERLGHPVRVKTDTGNPSVDESALRQMGRPGEILIANNTLAKELTYVDSYLELLRGERIHASYRVPGTLTGRLSGKDPNFQQIPTTRGCLGAFIPDTGNVFVDCDINALEQVVLAELSRDPALWSLYGPEAGPNDIYLWVGAQIPALAPAIRAAGYDWRNPTPQGIASAKRGAKKERAITKVVVLSSSYGAGPAKIFDSLTLQGVDITFEEVKDIHHSYWEIFAGVTAYQEEKEQEWRANGRGWVLNGAGRPMCVAEEYRKDIVNRICQSTGHDILLRYIQIVASLLAREGIKWYPVIVDFHDEVLLEVAEEHGERVAHLMGVEAFRILNQQELGWDISLKGGATICRSLADAKLEQ